MIRTIAAALLSFVFSLIYNGFVHFIILGSANKEAELLRRTDFSSKAWLSILGTLVTSILFAIVYKYFISAKSIMKGIAYGFSIGLLIVVMVDLNQYVLYPLPFSLITQWAFFGLLEFSLLGLFTGSIIKDDHR